MSKAETIDIGKGIQYAKVAARLAELHESHKQCNIETSVEFKDGWAMFRATVTTGKGTFTGHSMSKVGLKQKDFEKQETIAVGRALAFAGFLSSGDIASQEEMAAYAEPTPDQSYNMLKAEMNRRGINGKEAAEHICQWSGSTLKECYDDPAKSVEVQRRLAELPDDQLHALIKESA